MNRLLYILILIGLIGVFVIISSLQAEEKSIVNIVNIVGTVFSIVAFIIAIIQLNSIKKISIITNSTIEETKNKLKNSFSISDVSRGIKIIQEIQNYMSTDKYELARMRLQDLKPILIQLEQSVEFVSIFDSKDSYENSVLEIEVNISNFYDVIQGKRKINIGKLKLTLEKLSSVLIKYEQKLKFKTI